MPGSGTWVMGLVKLAALVPSLNRRVVELFEVPCNPMLTSNADIVS